MTVAVSFACRWTARPFGGSALAAVLLATVAARVEAQVIEIGDDGATRTFSGPTRFVSGEVGRDAPRAETRRVDDQDRYGRVAQAEGVDVRLLRAIAWTESRGRMGAVSRKGAVGIMQLMPATAAALGVDPLDEEGNVTGGARYFARMMSRFQSVPLALAAYNAGPGAVLRWGGIPPYAETRSYVASVLSRLRGGSAMPVIGGVPAVRFDSLLIEVP